MSNPLKQFVEGRKANEQTKDKLKAEKPKKKSRKAVAKDATGDKSSKG